MPEHRAREFLSENRNPSIFFEQLRIFVPDNYTFYAKCVHPVFFNFGQCLFYQSV